MLTLNFSHPLSGEYQVQIAVLARATISKVRTVLIQLRQMDRWMHNLINGVSSSSRDCC
jgi:hypothetical protein